MMLGIHPTYTCICAHIADLSHVCVFDTHSTLGMVLCEPFVGLWAHEP